MRRVNGVCRAALRQLPSSTTPIVGRGVSGSSNGVVNDTSKLLHCYQSRRPLNQEPARRAEPIADGSGGFSTPLLEFADIAGIDSHESLYRFSVDCPTEFWGRLGRSRLRWHQPFQKAMDCDMPRGKIGWFTGGKLNVADNCVDRHYEVHPNRIALIWEKDEPGHEEYITYRQLYKLTNRLANTLKAHGIQRGDRVVIYLPVSPIAVASMLACARIGALHSVVFAGFSASALAARIEDANAETVITTDQAVRGGKLIELKQVVNEAVHKCRSVKRVFVSQRTGNVVTPSRFDIPLEEEMSKQPTTCPQESMDSEDYLFLLYTSGSTGKPKGVVHTQAGYLLHAGLSHQTVFDYTPGDIFGCVADIGWITGHSYAVYGPLCNGGTSVLFESTPTYPHPGRYWETIERLGINQFYCAPTAIRLLMKYDDEYATKFDLSTLKTLGSVGEPLNHEAWVWYNELIGKKRCPIVDTWWQSETGGIMITPRPSNYGAEIIPAMPMRPFYGIDPALVNEKGEEITESDAHGALCVRQPWPGLARTIYGDHDRYLQTYFAGTKQGYYITGDGAHRIDGKYYRITGRMDDVINTSGHRIGTAEIEDVIDEHELVSESAIVGIPHDLKGEGIYAFVTLKELHPEVDADIKKDLNKLIRQQIAAYAVPDEIQFVPSLPKTRSGKIMRRVLRKIAMDKSDDIGDTSTLSDPHVVSKIVQDFHKLKAERGDKK
jgi:acetyl-CoA synthetase